jgi:phage FluMu gp28-like protein
LPEPAVKLYGYQQRYLADHSRFKVARWARQTGKSFACSLEPALDGAEQPMPWVILSRGERQSKEVIEKVRMHAQAIGAVAEYQEYDWVGEAVYKALEVRYPNGTKIIGLPANPDTARGFSANVILDEFALHKDSRKIWAALFPVITRGYRLRVVSTPMGKQNKFYDLCTADNHFSKHVTDIYQAVEDGLDLRDEDGNPSTPEDLREALDDAEAWEQEYLVKFIDEATAYLTYDLIAECEDEACLEELERGREYYLGMDVGRKRDLSIIWVTERVGEIIWTREITVLERASFPAQRAELYKRLPFVHRACIDSTGLGMQLAEEAQTAFGTYKVEPVNFTLKVKEDLASTVRARMEDQQVRLPIDRAIRDDLHSVKKITTSAGNTRYDAERTGDGHADRFWALALALHAGSTPAGPIEYRTVEKRRFAGHVGAW